MKGQTMKGWPALFLSLILATAALAQPAVQRGTGIAGDVGSTNNAICRADGTGGQKVKGSLCDIDDSGNLTCPGSLGTGGSAAGSWFLEEQDANGTDKITVSAPASLTTSYNLTLQDDATPFDSVISNYAASSTQGGDATGLEAGALDATTEIDGGLCGTNEILEDQGASWACISTPSGGGGDSVSVNGSAATDANLADSPSIKWSLDTSASPDDVVASYDPDEDAFLLVEEFIAGQTGGTANVGSHGWSVSAGNMETTGVANHPGILTMITAASTSSEAWLYLSAAATTPHSGVGLVDQNLWTLEWIARVNEVTEVEIYFGFTPNVAFEDAAILGFALDSGASAANWFCQSGGPSDTTTDTGVTADTGWHRFRMERVSGGDIEFYIDDTLECTHSTDTPTASQMLGMNVLTTEDASKTVDVDRVKLRMELTR